MTTMYRGPGDKLTHTAPGGGVVQGTGYVIGAEFVVANETKAAGLPLVGSMVGLWLLPHQNGEAITAGARAWWDAGTATVRNASAAGRFLIGTCPEAVGAADARAMVRLDGIAVVAI
jgi:predicted RecA/RadA family phage recombinase